MNFMSKVANQLVEDGVANGQTIREIYVAIQATKHLGITPEQVADAVNACRQANKVGDEQQVLLNLGRVHMPWDGKQYLAPPRELVARELVGFAAFCKKYKFIISVTSDGFVEMPDNTMCAWFAVIHAALQRHEATAHYHRERGTEYPLSTRDVCADWEKFLRLINN